MIFSKIQKILASFLIFIFFFGQITGLSFIGLFTTYNTYAESKVYHDLVSIIVNEKTYKELDGKINRYAEDIQKYLNNTKVIILPIKKINTSFEIMSLNESLFTDGYKSLKDVNFESRLVGTILIGQFPIPLISKDGKIAKSIIPYVDFEDKKYIYNPETQLFEENSDNLKGFHAEIWQGIISPNTGNFDGNIKEIGNFLDKDHDFYEGKGLFDNKKEILNGNKNDKVSENYKPFIFYFDQIREQNSINAVSYKGYEAYINNKEDIVYHRYTKDLAKKIRDEIMGEANDEVKKLIQKLPKTNKIGTSVARAQYMLIQSGQADLAKQLGEDSKKGVYGQGPDLEDVNDISTKILIEKATNKFIQVFNPGTIADFRTNVHNAGRYNVDRQTVNIDMIPSIISILDVVGDKVIKSATNGIENQIDDVVIDHLAKKITIPTEVGTSGINSSSKYVNYYAGRKASDLKFAADCSVYRGSTLNDGQLVEANRGLDIRLANNDANNIFFDNDGNRITNPCGTPGYTKGVFGGSSPLNIDNTAFKPNGGFELKLKNYDLNKAILPIFNISGAKKTTDVSKNLSPKNCLNTNFIKTIETVTGDENCSEKYHILQLPGMCNSWSCSRDNIIDTSIRGNNSKIVSIPSYIIHKSPTLYELNKQIEAKFTPNLPVDKVRYIDYFSENVDVITGSGANSYKKIVYPNLFKIKGTDTEEIKKNLDKILDDKSNEIKNLGGNINLKDYLKNKVIKTVKIGGEDKKYSFYDFVIFSIYWNNLHNTSSRYKFVLQNYLSDQVGGNQFDFVLANNKKEYEIAYLGAHGDAQNMYVMMDTKGIKVGANPYTNTFQANSKYEALTLPVRMTDPKNYTPTNSKKNKGMFKCAPPDGVPIWVWIPAIICRLKSILPPKVGIKWVCGTPPGGGNDGGGKQKEKIDPNNPNNPECKEDKDKNGINDCIQQQLKGAKISLSSDKIRYHYNQFGRLQTKLLDKDGKEIYLDNFGTINYQIDKIIDRDTNKVVFDSKKDNFDEKFDIISQYVFFMPSNVVNTYGNTNFTFNAKSKRADIYFKAYYKLKPVSYNIPGIDLKNSGFGGYNMSLKVKKEVEKLSTNTNEIKLNSNNLLIKIRNSKLFIDSRYTDKDKKLDAINNEIIANNDTNIYLIGNKDFGEYEYNPNSLILKLVNFDEQGKKRAINFPIKVTLKNQDLEIIEEETIKNLGELKKLYSLTKAGKYRITIKDSFNFETENNFEITAGIPTQTKIKLGTTIMSNSGTTTNVVSIYDKFENIVVGKIFDYKIKIIGDSLTFGDDSQELDISSFEGYKVFQLKANGKLGNIKIAAEILDEKGNKLTGISKTIRIIDELKIDLQIDNNQELKVGNKKYTAILTFKDKTGKILNDLNSRTYIKTPGKYLDFDSSFYEIKNGKAIVKFNTRTTAGEDIVLKIRTEGFIKTNYKHIKILPGKPMSISILPEKTKLEANPKASSRISVILKDIYKNTVFTDNDTKINLEILDQYKSLLTTKKDEIQLKKGVANFEVNATTNPGIIYIKFKTDKKLEDNFVVLQKGKKKQKINGISENATRLETFFFYKKSEIIGRKYNALYTTLLGAEYGDILQKDYLASGMLFDKNNRSLAVTSLLNNPYHNYDVLSISNNGIIQKTIGGDMTQDLSVELLQGKNNKYYLDLFNKGLNVHIGKIYLNFDDLNISDETYDKITNDDIINLGDLGIEKFESFYVDSDALLDAVLKKQKNSIVFQIETQEYYLRNILLGEGKKAIAISYNDPFAGNYELNDFTEGSLDSYENFEEKDNLGWAGGNKTLLEFAAGSSVGEASRKYMGVFGITLGDPVISLKKIRPKYKGIEKKFDPTTGKKLNNTRIKTYRTFDYNSDGKIDILLVENNGFLSLLENKESKLRFLNQKHLARIFDLGKPDLILTGDFSGDSYDDIFYVDKKGEPHLLNNDTKDFVFYDLKESFKLKGEITQAKSFDMDHDGVDDIVTLDTFGEINIFYGRKDSITKFDKKLVYDGYGIKLNETERSSLGAIYFDGLRQNLPTQNNIIDSKDEVPLDILQGIMFEELPYNPDLENATTMQDYTITTKFLKSEFAKDLGISITKKLTDKNGGNLMKGDIVKVELKIKNNTNKTLKDIVYAEDIPKFFKINYGSIQFKKAQITTRKNLLNYKFYLDKFELKPGQEITVYYTMKTKTLLYKYIKVGLFEKGEAGDDEYGDILVKETPYNCGGDSDLFRSIDKRKYQKGIKEETCYGAALPEVLAKNEIDQDGNGIPDYIDKLSNNESDRLDYSKTALDEFTKGELIDEDMDPTDIDSYIGTGALFDTKNMIQGFNCGFGNNDCYCSPVNWAPLAPGNDLVIYGKLVGDGLKIDEGIPVFSALTWKMSGPSCVPAAYPCSSKSVGCSGKGAGGYLGIDNPTNFFRLFITPTLTGSFGIAACFGAPARKAGAKPPKGMNPVVPGGNCLIWAKKLKNTCKDELPKPPDEPVTPPDDPNPSPYVVENCSASQINPQKLPITNKIDTKLARSFLESLQKGQVDPKLTDYFDNLKNGIDYMDHVDEKLLKGANENNTQASDSNGGDFQKVDQIINRRIPAFPNFFMSWVHDQNEEFINKLTNMPTLHIILPEFKSTNNGDWGKYADKMSKTPEALENTSGIKEAFNFMGNVPFMHVTPEPVNVNVPWGPNLDSTMKQWQASTSQWQSELNRVTQEAGNKMRPENIIKINKFRNSLMSNMQTIQSYMQLPKQISDLAGKKQKRLQQLLCYIEQMQKMTSGWIGKNGQRFKAWTQAYLTIKSALKSWQAILDVFIKYDNECHECKNERHDSLNAQFKIVDMVMPKIPIVKFPKWPDLVLDLHNIRIGMNVKIPEFKFQKRPMVMPQVPSLSLPSVSDCINFSIDLPALPQLPKIQMPKLPDLPAIPVVEMPDLPPPPKLPKMFGSLEAMVDMSKLITKAMCILKKLPFFPEVRAGDEIAFLTEGHGYRKSGGKCNLSFNFDFINLKLPKLPNPSIKFLKEIRVIVKINMQKDLDFLVKMAKAIVKPINSMTNNFSNKFGNMGINLDFSGLCDKKTPKKKIEHEGFIWTNEEDDYMQETEIPKQEDYETGNTQEGRYKTKIYNENSINPKGTNKIDTGEQRKLFKDLLNDSSSFKLTPLNLGKAISIGIQKVQSCIAQNADNTVSVPEFLTYVNKQLASPRIINDPKLKQLRKSFDLVNNYTYSKEDKLIEKLQKQNIDKFSTLRNIIRQEIKKTEKLKYEIINKKYHKISNNNLGVETYNKALKKYNKTFEKSLDELFKPTYFDLKGLKKDGEKFKKKINDKLENFNKNTLGNDLLAYNSPSEYAYDTTSVSKCNKDHKTQRKYKGIYIYQEEENIKLYYRLFEYLKEWSGKGRVEHIDFDQDTDSDILYLMRGNLYLKENLLKNKAEIHLNGVEVLDIEDNKFVNGDTFYEVVNNSRESFAANKFMNIYFSASKNKNLNNYRLGFYQIIDKYQNLGNSSYVPENIKKYIVDSFVSDSEIRKIEKNGTFTTYKDLAYINNIGDNIGKVVLKTKMFKNIKESLKNGNVATLGANQNLYAGKNDVTIKYIDEEQEKTLTIKAHTHIQSIYGIKITSITNDAYIMSEKNVIVKGREILDYIGLPLAFESKITLNDNNFITNSESYIDIKYYDGSEANLDFSKIKYYYLYDLGSQNDSYVITLNVENDFYYARMQVFKNNIFSTKTSQILLSPQLKADKFAPEIDLNDAIRIPVYQKRLIDITDSIYEDSGFSGIEKFEVEGLDKDKVKVYLTNQSIKISFGKFNTIFKKQIKFIVTDKNENKTEKMIDFEVYTPIPEIDYVSGTGAISGHINEELTDEPVNIYRYRGGRIEKLITINDKTKVNTTKGDYVFNAKIIKSDLLEVRENAKVIFTVNQNTGKIIGLNNFKYDIKTFIDKDNFINIAVNKKIGNNKKVIFKEKIYMKENETGIRQYRSFNEIKDDGLYFKLKDEKYDYYKIPDNVEHNPGAIIIYKKSDSHKLPLFAIGTDARVKTLNNFYRIEYSDYGKYILLKLRNKHDNKIIGEFYLKVNNAFLIR